PANRVSGPARAMGRRSVELVGENEVHQAARGHVGHRGLLSEESTMSYDVRDVHGRLLGEQLGGLARSGPRTKAPCRPGPVPSSTDPAALPILPPTMESPMRLRPMFLMSILRSVCNRVRGMARGARRRIGKSAKTPLYLEPLEDRTLLSTTFLS